jgi:predicted  nucleic acid-binding Zn-ribbon protein
MHAKGNMLIKVKCEHCGNIFETDGMNRTEFCPHCGKETSILAQVTVPALGVPQSHRLWAKIKRPLILFILLPVAIVGVICYRARQDAIAQAAAQAEKWKQEHTLTPLEENEVLEKLAARAARTDLELWEMNHPDWKTGNALIDADTEQTHSNSFYYEELEKIKQIPTK